MKNVGDTDAKQIRALVAKPGLDGHDRGAKVVSLGLRDAGFQVIYTGLRQTPEAIAHAALQEDVDVVCLSILSGAHLGLCRRIQLALKQLDLDVPVIVGGIIPDGDRPPLAEMGIAAVFGPGSNLNEIAETIRSVVGR